MHRSKLLTVGLTLAPGLILACVNDECALTSNRGHYVAAERVEGRSRMLGIASVVVVLS